MDNHQLRAIEIRFFLLCFDLARLTKPNNNGNIYAFLEFIEKIDFTNSVEHSIIKELAQTIMTEKNNITPNKEELCNYCMRTKIAPTKMDKYTKISGIYYSAFVNRVANEPFFQPTHLQPHVYVELENFLALVTKVKNLGVYENANKTKRKTTK